MPHTFGTPDTPITSAEEFVSTLHTADQWALYGYTLVCQMQLYKPSIVAMTQSLPVWPRAQSVLDVGCGPATLLQCCPELLAEKSYTGIDPAPEFIRIATAIAQQHPACVVHQQSLFDVRNQQYDLIYMSAVLQHVPSVADALCHARQLLAPNGVTLIFDHEGRDANMPWSPAVPSIASAYAELARVSDARGRNSRSLADVEACAADAGLAITWRAPAPYAASDTPRRWMMARYAACASELMQRMYAIDSNRLQIVTDLIDWAANDHAHIHVTNAAWIALHREETNKA